MSRSSTALVCAAALAFTTSALAQRPAIDFKGLAPGGDASVVTTHAAWDCKPGKVGGADTVCTRRHETIAGAEAVLVLVGVKEEKILSIFVSFSQKDFTSVFEALVLKYGKPDNSRKEIKTNRMGASFPSVVAEWKHQSRNMRLEERTSRVDSSALFISSQESSLASQKQRAEQAEKNKTDL